MKILLGRMVKTGQRRQVAVVMPPIKKRVKVENAKTPMTKALSDH